MKARVLLADDHRMLREALHLLLQDQSDLEVVAQTGNGLDVSRLAHETLPHVVCMDIQMPGMDGIDATRALLATLPSTKVVALSAHAEPRYVLDMLGAGASAYVTKGEASDELLRAIRAVLLGRTYLCPDVAGVVASAAAGHGRGAVPNVVLGARERQVLKLVAEGHTSHTIGEKLFIAASTVEVHRRNIMRKLDLHSVAELTRYVVHNERA